MKSGTETKVKFKKLQRRLNLPLWQTIGLLEALWQATIQNAICGDIGRLSDEDIAAAIDWRDEEGALISALVDCGWLDECPVHRLIVHDWAEHCPTFVRGNIAKHGKEFAKQQQGEPAKQDQDDVAKQPGAKVLPNLTKPNLTNSSQTKPNLDSASAESVASATGIPSPSEFIDRWNRFAERHPSIKRVARLTKERREKLRVRLKDTDWWATFQTAIRMLPLPGGDNWQPDLNWIIRNETNVYRIVEGEFSWRAKDDPAMAKLEKAKAANAAKEREERLALQKRKRMSESVQVSRAIDDILNPTPGGNAAQSGASLLYGGEGDSCVNGAGNGRARDGPGGSGDYEPTPENS